MRLKIMNLHMAKPTLEAQGSGPPLTHTNLCPAGLRVSHYVPSSQGSLKQKAAPHLFFQLSLFQENTLWIVGSSVIPHTFQKQLASLHQRAC